jgi:hypothetical protein
MAKPWRRRPEQPGGGRRLSRPVGCLLWLVLLVVILVLLSLLFGGFRMGTRAGDTGPAPVIRAAAAVL